MKKKKSWYIEWELSKGQKEDLFFYSSAHTASYFMHTIKLTLSSSVSQCVIQRGINTPALSIYVKVNQQESSRQTSLSV